MHQLFGEESEVGKTPDGKAMRGIFSDELEKNEKESSVKQVVVTPGPKAMTGLFEPDAVAEQKEFDGRTTSVPLTPDKVDFEV